MNFKYALLFTLTATIQAHTNNEETLANSGATTDQQTVDSATIQPMPTISDITKQAIALAYADYKKANTPEDHAKNFRHFPDASPTKCFCAQDDYKSNLCQGISVFLYVSERVLHHNPDYLLEDAAIRSNRMCQALRLSPETTAKEMLTMIGTVGNLQASLLQTQENAKQDE